MAKTRAKHQQKSKISVHSGRVAVCAFLHLWNVGTIFDEGKLFKESYNNN